jgi:hypothetical protein
VFANDARRVIAFEAVRYGFMSSRSIVKLDKTRVSLRAPLL